MKNIKQHTGSIKNSPGKQMFYDPPQKRWVHETKKLNRLRALMFIIALLFCFNKSFAQWSNVGTPAFTANNVSFTSVAVYGNTTYMSFSEPSTSRPSVVKYNGSSWSYVGASSFWNAAGDISLAIDGSGTPYVAFKDYTLGQRITVMKYNGTSWAVVGTSGISTGTSDYCQIAIDGTGAPYVVYRDQSVGYMTIVKKFIGSGWVSLGSSVSASSSYFCSIAINSSNVPYVIYMDDAAGSGATVKYYNGSSWTTVGSPNLSGSVAYYSQIALDNSGNPYAFYMDASAGYKGTVKKFVGGSWTTVGSAGLSAGNLDYLKIAISSTGIPYVSYRDQAFGNIVAVKKFDGSAWVSAGSGSISTGSVNSPSLAMKVDTPYLAYVDGTASNRGTVKRYIPELAGITGTGTICIGGTTTLSNSTAGGTWSSTATGIATINTSTGVVSGIAAGTTTISYIAGSNSTTTIVTVNSPTLPAIAGNTSLSAATTTQLSNAVTGGMWSSTNTSVATVNSSNGLVSGLSVGSTVISYTATIAGCGSNTTSAIVNVVAPNAAIHFDGTNDFATVPNDAAFETNTGTIEMWVKPTWSYGSRPGNPTLGSMRPTTLSNTRWSFHMNNTYNAIGMYNGSTYSTVSYSFSAHTWYHVAFVYSTSNCAVYINGVFIGNTGNGINPATGNALRIGMADDGYFNEDWLGNIDEFRIWNVQRTQAEIQANMSCEIDTNANLVGYYRFNNGTPNGTNTGLTVIDHSGHNRNGTFVNMALTGTTSNFVTGAVGNCSGATETAPITGTLSVCTGSTTALSNTTADGTWSSSNTDVATVSSTGVVTGVSSGTVTISYAASTTVTAIVTVNAAPAAIAGTDAVCTGKTITLSNSATGGTWSSSSSSTASVGSATGIVSGNSAGFVNITYTMPGGCFTSFAINVMATPSISGATQVCAGTSATLSASIAEGTWSSSNGDVATINSVTGIVSGISAGNATMTYTLSTGCYATYAFTVNPQPASISGVSSVCEGSSITLSNVTSGGSWTSSDAEVATISGSGIVNGILAGSATVSYTLSTGCRVTRLTTVKPMPSAIYGSEPMCTVASITLSNSIEGGTWSSANTSIASVNATTGVVTATGEGITNITYTLPAGCYTTTTVNSLVAPISVVRGLCIAANGEFANLTSGGTWSSSDTSVASIVDTSGAAYGVSVGSATLTYTLGSGCYRVLTVFVDSVPAPIVGPHNICIGSSTTLTDASLGGTWSGLSTGVVDGPGSTGVVTGMTLGTSTITYSLSPLCKAYHTVTVNSVPVAINGTRKVCQGQTTTLVNATAGGSWNSGNTSVATVNTSGVVTGVSGGTVVISYALTSGCASTAIVTVNPTPANITGTTTICAGKTSTLSSTTPLGISWTSSNTGIATVNSSGVVNAVSAGNANITYTINTGCYTTVAVSVTPLPSVITGAGSVCSSSTITLVDADAGGTWNSSNTTAATVDAAGAVSGLSQGVTTITYTLNSCIRTKSVTVNPTPTATTSAVICAGSTASVSATPAGGAWSSNNTSVATTTAPYINGIATGNATVTYSFTSGCYTTIPVTVNAAPASITGTANIGVGASSTLANAVSGGTWSSNNTAIATVDSATGIVTGVSGGTATISYIRNNCFATKVFTVGALPTITGNLNVCEGATSALSITTPGGSWISSNTAVATVGSASGIVTAITAGTSTITYQLPSGAYQVATFSVQSALPAISSASFEICSGATTTLNNTTTGGTWSSSTTSVATVGSSTGIVTGGSGSGTTTITYTMSAGCKATAIITLNQLPAVIGGTPGTYVGSTTTLSNTIAGGVWTSGTPAVATVSTSGVVSGEDAGTSVITYTLGSCSRTVIVTVDPAPDPIGGPATLCVGQTATLTHSVSGGTWSQYAPAGIVDGPGSAGVITGLSAGTGSITYTLPSGAKTYFTVTVNVMPAAISGASRVCQSQNTTLSTTSAGGTWSSSSPTLASIDASTGVVTGVATGTAVTSYTGTNGCYRTAIMTIDATPATITGTASIQVGATTTLSSATAGAVSWTSSTPSVATVNSTTGVVTGVAVGNTTITYTIGSGCNTTTVVTVTPSSAPSAISGPSAVCTGSSITLSNTVSGGTWSGNNGNVSVGSATGIVTGVTAGVSVVTYTTAPGVFVTKMITSNASPAASGGYKIACVGLTTQLTNVSGGTWTSSDTFTAKATIGGSNSIITGIAPGTANITFKLTATGCSNVTQVTVNTVPPAITGNSPVCVSNQLTLANAQAGGSWSSSNTTVANINSATGIITAGTTANVSTISYSFGANCRVTTVVTVRPVPGGISGVTTACPATTTTLSCGTPNGTWSSSNVAAATVNTGSSSNYGAVSAVATGVTTITYTTAPSCFSTKTFNVGACREANATGVEHATTDVNMSLYPNPTNGSFVVKANNTGVLSVYSLEGKEIAKYDVNKGETQITLPNNLARGIYMCRFNGNEGSAVMVRLIVD